MNKSDLKRDYFMLKGPLAKKGYDWWWHSLTAYNYLKIKLLVKNHPIVWLKQEHGVKIQNKFIIFTQ